MDLIIFSGQSNMQGQTEGVPYDNTPIIDAYEYLYKENKFKPLQHPVGEDLEENGQALLLGSHNGYGSLIPDFCRIYVKKSGRKTLVVHAAKGATTIAEWKPNTLRYAAMVRKILSAKERAKEIEQIENVYFVWLQGESDAIDGTLEMDYYNHFIELKDTLKKDVGVTFFGIIKVGYFASQATWYNVGDMESRIQKDKNIMNAQERIVRENDDCIMLTRISEELSKNKKYINPFESGHYNNKAMKIIGEEAAQELCKYIKI